MGQLTNDSSSAGVTSSKKDSPATSGDFKLEGSGTPDKSDKTGVNSKGGQISRGDSASTFKDQALDVANQVGTQTRDLVTSTVTKRQEQSAMDLNGFAEALRKSGKELESSFLGPMVCKAADQVDRASEYLMDADLKTVVRSTEKFARREPLLFLGGAFTLGLLCARFIKSSAVSDDSDDSVEKVRP